MKTSARTAPAVDPVADPAAAVSAALVTWEAWRDARAGAAPITGLSTLEALRVLNEVRCFGRIPFVLVGLPLRRGDLDALVAHGTRIGLRMRVAPGPDALSAYHVQLLAGAGLERVCVGSGERSWPALDAELAVARAAGLAVEVRTEVASRDVSSLRSLGVRLAAAGVGVWTLGFPASPAPELLDGGLDAMLREVAVLATELPMRLEVEGAPQFRRVAHGHAARGLVSLVPAEGRELLHVAADGSLQPSATLAVCVGHAREQDVVDAFREAPLLCALRDPRQLGGKCRTCEWVSVCGGSRGRAWALTGDMFAPDPACSYVPGSAPDASRPNPDRAHGPRAGRART